MINKTTRFGPSIQHVTKDYGSKWAITFLKNTRELVSKDDINALYSIALFYPVKHTQFPGIDDDFAEAIFEYIDSFKYDSSQTNHRRVSFEIKRRFVDSVRVKVRLYD